MFLKITKVCVLTFCMYIIVLLCIQRYFAFNLAYTDFSEQLQNEKWLLLKCTDSDFFANMAFVSNICREVIHNSEISQHWNAFQSSVLGNVLGNVKYSRHELDTMHCR